ncbi:uncharacterized protein TNCV_3403581 [Trichonephila clavipes]|nr:uncharacterized protein TNCV_3403581 [Trichonephila clavipes]
MHLPLIRTGISVKAGSSFVTPAVSSKLLGAVNTRKNTRTENSVWSDQEDHEERGSKDRAASTCGPHSDSFNDTSRRRRSNCSTNKFQTPCRSKSLIQASFPCTPFNTEHRQLRLQWCQARSMAIFQQDNARPHTERAAQDFLRHFQTLPWPASSLDLSPVEHVWDQLKWQMPSCHSVHDLELAVQDLWAHLPEDNIRCLINSMLDRVAACIAAGGGPTRY